MLLEWASLQEKYLQCYEADVFRALVWLSPCVIDYWILLDSKVHGANMGPIWGRQDRGGPHVGPINVAIWAVYQKYSFYPRPVLALGIADIAKTFGPLPDRRNNKHGENSGFTGPPKVLQDIF